MAGLRKLWLEHAEGKGKRTVGDDKRRFERIVDHFGATKRVATLLPKDVTELMTALKNEKNKRGRPMMPATINRHR
jgi:hypothetical protein